MAAHSTVSLESLQDRWAEAWGSSRRLVGEEEISAHGLRAAEAVTPASACRRRVRAPCFGGNALAVRRKGDCHVCRRFALTLPPRVLVVQRRRRRECRRQHARLCSAGTPRWLAPAHTALRHAQGPGLPAGNDWFPSPLEGETLIGLRIPSSTQEMKSALHRLAWGGRREMAAPKRGRPEMAKPEREAAQSEPTRRLSRIASVARMSFSSKDDEDSILEGPAPAGVPLPPPLRAWAANDELAVTQITADKQAFMRNMSRWDLFLKCRRLCAHALPAASSAAPAGAGRSDFFRTQAVHSGASGATADQHGRSRAALQLRDLRCLQGISKPVIHVRDGAMVVTFDPIRAVITLSRIFIVLHVDDPELQPLMPRLCTNDSTHVSGIPAARVLPFELQALDAVLYTAFQFRMQVSNARRAKLSSRRIFLTIGC